MSSRRSVCRGCGAEIVWVKTTAGKSMPCNPGAVPFWARPGAPGKAITPLGKVVSCDFIGERDRVSGFGYVSHFSTCPKAKEFKRK